MSLTDENFQLNAPMNSSKTPDTKTTSEFLSKITHELRIPIAIIKEFTEVLDREIAGPLTSRQKEYLEIISRNGERVLRLIDNFINITRIEVGTLRLHRTTSDIKLVLQDAIKAMSIRFSKKNITLAVDISDNLPEVYVDTDALTQIVMNCLENAWKFSPEGNTVNVRVQLQDDVLYISVQDFGRGIPEKDLPYIFKPFYQGEDVDRERLGGTGLGLAIVKELVELHGGAVSVESTVKKGTTITMKIPAYQ
jgi:signal transduction histidine kinase